MLQSRNLLAVTDATPQSFVGGTGSPFLRSSVTNYHEIPGASPLFFLYFRACGFAKLYNDWPTISFPALREPIAHGSRKPVGLHA